jgi:serine/threonine protein kinase
MLFDSKRCSNTAGQNTLFGFTACESRKMDTLKIGSLITIEQFSKIRFVIAERRQGGMGAVYRLIPVNPDLSEYALKVVLGEGQVVDLAEREAQMWVSLGEYPGLARALWAGKWEGQPAILSHWYPRSADSITPDEWTYDSLVDFTVLLLEALSYANVRFGLVHRDIKPSNILVDAEMVPRLTDFGVSLMAPVDKAITQLDPLSSRTIRKCVTVSGIAGTPRYMAPELFAGYLPSIKSDIYALGVSLYEILTLEHPILDNAGHWRTAESQRRCLSRAFARITRARYDVLLESIIACISIDPSSRPTYSELLSKLPKSKSTMDRTGQRVALDSFHPNAPSIVSYATTLRNQGNPDQARGVLASALNYVPVIASTLSVY